MNSIKDRLARSIAQRGLIGTIPMCWWSLRSLLSPAARDVEKHRAEVDASFDHLNDVDTGGIIRPASDAVIGANWAQGVSYQAVDPAGFTEALNSVSLPHPEFTFIDFGSGKGRALLLAARFPFRRIVGVEYCEQMNEIARQNLSRTSDPARRCNQIEIIGGDAASFPIPDNPIVLFFFNPFGERVMEQVVKNVAVSFGRSPRRIVVIYFTPWFAPLWERTGFLRRIRESPAIFDTNGW
jgi:SAM-dependent methyltransferase